ncbi:MAG: hypothetical protein ABL907_05400, partial [Hyphomicrobium sp.]
TFIGLWAVGRLPGAFALPAGIGDLLVGGLALVAGWLALRRDDLGFAAVNAWNWFGAFDLVVAVSTGFLTSPGPYQLIALDRPNLLITSYPLSMVPLFAVPLSFILHAIVWMKLKDVAMVREDSDGAEVALT